MSTAVKIFSSFCNQRIIEMLQIFGNLLILFIQYLKRTAHLAILASLTCVSLKHIYICTKC